MHGRKAVIDIIKTLLMILLVLLDDVIACTNGNLHQDAEVAIYYSTGALSNFETALTSKNMQMDILTHSSGVAISAKVQLGLRIQLCNHSVSVCMRLCMCSVRVTSCGNGERITACCYWYASVCALHVCRADVTGQMEI